MYTDPVCTGTTPSPARSLVYEPRLDLLLKSNSTIETAIESIFSIQFPQMFLFNLTFHEGDSYSRGGQGRPSLVFPCSPSHLRAVHNSCPSFFLFLLTLAIFSEENGKDAQHGRGMYELMCRANAVSTGRADGHKERGRRERQTFTNGTKGGQSTVREMEGNEISMGTTWTEMEEFVRKNLERERVAVRCGT